MIETSSLSNGPPGAGDRGRWDMQGDAPLRPSRNHTNDPLGNNAAQLGDAPTPLALGQERADAAALDRPYALDRVKRPTATRNRTTPCQV